MAQVATVRQVKTHQAIMGSHDSLVDLEVCRASTQALDVDAPFLGIQVEGLESASLAGQLNGINVLVSTIVSGTGVALGVFVGHGRSQCIEHGTGRDIFGGDENDRFPLALDLGFLGREEGLEQEGTCRGGGLAFTMISAISGSVFSKESSRSCGWLADLEATQ